MANDSINFCVKNKLSAYLGESLFPWQMDSLICFNNELSKCIFSLAVRCPLKECTQDELKYFYGVMIHRNWYFFKGPSIAIPREKGVPLSFIQLHEIAMKEVFSGYLKKTWNGKWEINEAFFDRIEFQFEKWAYWDSNGKEIMNSKLSTDSLQKLYLDRIIYDKYRFQ